MKNSVIILSLFLAAVPAMAQQRTPPKPSTPPPASAEEGVKASTGQALVGLVTQMTTARDRVNQMIRKLDRPTANAAFKASDYWQQLPAFRAQIDATTQAFEKSLGTITDKARFWVERYFRVEQSTDLTDTEKKAALQGLGQQLQAQFEVLSTEYQQAIRDAYRGIGMAIDAPATPRSGRLVALDACPNGRCSRDSQGKFESALATEDFDYLATDFRRVRTKEEAKLCQSAFNGAAYGKKDYVLYSANITMQRKNGTWSFDLGPTCFAFVRLKSVQYRNRYWEKWNSKSAGDQNQILMSNLNRPDSYECFGTGFYTYSDIPKMFDFFEEAAKKGQASLNYFFDHFGSASALGLKDIFDTINPKIIAHEAREGITYPTGGTPVFNLIKEGCRSLVCLGLRAGDLTAVLASVRSSLDRDISVDLSISPPLKIKGIGRDISELQKELASVNYPTEVKDWPFDTP